MRRTLVAVLVLGFAAADASAVLAQSQQQRRQEQNTEQDRAEQRRRSRLDREMMNRDLPLPELGNAGPCPFVKVLYDAARTIDFVGGQPSSSAVAYSGEIDGLTATCRYQGAEPIVVEMNVTFSLGKGPQATSSQKDYGYWVAVTDRNRSVLAKEQFGFTAEWPAGSDRVRRFERIQQIVIPRANERISGENFEILVGFNVTPEMAEFNRQGTRFVVNATGRQQAAGAPSGQ